MSKDKHSSNFLSYSAYLIILFARLIKNNKNPNRLWLGFFVAQVGLFVFPPFENGITWSIFSSDSVDCFPQYIHLNPSRSSILYFMPAVTFLFLIQISLSCFGQLVVQAFNQSNIGTSGKSSSTSLNRLGLIRFSICFSLSCLAA